MAISCSKNYPDVIRNALLIYAYFQETSYEPAYGALARRAPPVNVQIVNSPRREARFLQIHIFHSVHFECACDYNPDHDAHLKSDGLDHELLGEQMCPLCVDSKSKPRVLDAG